MKENAFIKVLRIAPFRNLWLSQVFSQVFLNVLFFSLMIRIYELTHSNAAVSVMILAFSLPNFLLGAVAGVLVDRWERKMVMFFSHFLRIFAVLAFLISAETLGWLYVMAVLIALISLFFYPAEAASLPEVVKDKKLLITANSLFTLTFFSSVILGNVLAGPFLKIFGVHGNLLIISFAFILASIFTAKLPGESIWHWVKGNWHGELLRFQTIRQEDLEHGAIFQDFLAGLDFIYRNKTIQRGIFVMGVSQITIAILGSIAPGFADKILHIDVNDVSVLVMAPAAFGMVFGAWMVGQYFGKAKKSVLIGGGTWVLGGGLFALAVVDLIAGLTGLPILVFSLIFLVLLGAANAFLDIPANTLVQEKTPEEVRSRIYGVISTVIGAAGIIPVMMAGALADVFGVRFVMLGCGVLIGTAAFYLYNRRTDYVSITT